MHPDDESRFPVDADAELRREADRLRLPASTGLPFAEGDVFVGATQLDNPDDDHAGMGRILQFDADLHPRGVFWLGGTTHLIYGLSFAPDGTLWAQDPWAWTTVRVSTDGRQLENLQFAQRGFSKVHFMADGTLLFTEILGGDHQPLPLTTRHRPLPGHRTRLGDGMLWRFAPDGEVVEMQEPEFHGGMTGSMAVTHSVLSKDESVLVYVSETGPRLMRFDLQNGRQLPDIRRAADGDRTMMHFDLSRLPDDRLLVCMGNRLEAVADDGRTTRTWPLPGFGWSIIDARNGTHAYIGNWFTGVVAKFDLARGEIVAEVKVAEKCMAGIAQYLPVLPAASQRLAAVPGQAA